MKTIYEGTVRDMWLSETGEPPNLILETTFILPKEMHAAVIDVDYDPISNKVIETPAGICDFEVVNLSIPWIEKRDPKLNDFVGKKIKVEIS